ncbi:Tim10/DDP family zinc finger protein [Absidia repens]|uniref:Mitochondrial import inner membrane translocase subunit n=1 Tax=Absidia repens TaxID=90262 RepID=A0A1X2HY75_9FUNG|nr:Tim10/DDP family zinc finger protein [Absidia repens]
MRQQQAIDPQNIIMAEQELEMVTDLFNRISDSCYSKCVSRQYEQHQLSDPESSCVDVCVAKFTEINTKVGQKLQTMGQQ